MEQAEVKIRLAQRGDAESMSRLSRRCFKKSPEWFVPIWWVNRWWRGAMSSRGACVWVAELDGEVVGYLLCTENYQIWGGIRRHGCHARWVKGLVTLVRPSFLKSRLRKWKRAKGVSAGNGGGGELRADHVRNGDSVVNGFEDNGLRSRGKSILVDGGAYLAIVAVDPAVQGRGTGKLFVEQTEMFGKKTGSGGVCLHVDARNVRAQGLYERYGYCLCGRDGGSVLMVQFFD